MMDKEDLKMMIVGSGRGVSKRSRVSATGLYRSMNTRLDGVGVL
jgi:hypothetical protein